MAFESVETLRARFALARVNAAGRELGANSQEYRTLVRQLPALLHGGLLQTLAFLHAKGNEGTPHELILSALRDWLSHQDCPVVPLKLAAGNRALLDAILASEDPSDVWPLDEEAARFARWLKVWVEVQGEGQ